MYRLSFFFFLFFLSVSSFAQKKGKTRLLIYGQGEAALTSAVQASNSGVNTVWINPEKSFKSILTEGAEIKKINSYQNIDAGLWANFLKLSLNSPSYSDSVFNRAKAYLNPRISMNAFEKMIDSCENLKVIYKTGIRKIKKSGKKWKVELSNGESYNVYAVVDASMNSQLLSYISKKDKLSDSTVDSVPMIPMDQLYGSDIYKTSLLVLDDQTEFVIPAVSLIRPYADNFFVLYGPNGLLKDLKESIEAVPTKMLYGQTLGAIASYCAFFEVKADKINIRTLQGELLAFKGQMLPFHDVPFEDPHYASIQRIGLTGMIKGKMGNVDNESSKLIFDINSRVSSKELEPTMRRLYTRSQIWFSDKSIDELKLKDLLSLIKFIALKGDELDSTVEKGWTKKFNFSGDYDPECFLTRKQTAVLIDTYLQPFNIKVDEKGNFKY